MDNGDISIIPSAPFTLTVLPHLMMSHICTCCPCSSKQSAACSITHSLTHSPPAVVRQVLQWVQEDITCSRPCTPHDLCFFKWMYITCKHRSTLSCTSVELCVWHTVHQHENRRTRNIKSLYYKDNKQHVHMCLTDWWSTCWHTLTQISLLLVYNM